MNLKRKSLALHHYLAPVIALFIVFQAVTGIASAWRWDIARFIDHQAMTGTPAGRSQDIGNLFEIAGTQLPLSSATRIFFPQDSEGVFLFQISTENGERYASVNPADGKVLKSGKIWDFPVEAALKLHSQPFSGQPGYILVLMTGGLLTIMGLSGLIYWWPRGGNWWSRLVINFRHPIRLVLRNMHRTAGICLVPLLLMMAVTGMFLASELIATANSSTSTGTVRYTRIDNEHMDEILRLAKTQFPHSLIRDIRLQNDGPVTVQLWQPGTERWSLQRVIINAQRDKVTEVIPPDQNSAIWIKFLPFHTGSIAGLAGRIIVTLTAVGLMMLTFLGIYLWLTKHRRP